jgi:hypothetical protein
MIGMCGITPDMRVLDPCYGAGAFYDNLPECRKSYCEIDMGHDFFDEAGRYDLIIGNPPFSLWSKWLEHTIKLTDKFCYIFGAMNLTPFRIDELETAGFSLVQLASVKVEYWFGTQWIAIFEKHRPSILTTLPTFRFNCDVCGERCLRGVAGRPMNACCPKPKRKVAGSSNAPQSVVLKTD